WAELRALPNGDTAGPKNQDAMTKPEFTGPGLSADQWHRIDALATDLTPEQAIWISGFFAGAGHSAGGAAKAVVSAGRRAAPMAAGSPASATRTLSVLFGSETGNSAGLARSLADAARAQGIAVELFDMADYKVRRLKEEQDLLVVTSTHGEGDPPQTAADFFEFLEGRKAPQLPHLRFAVLALGDSTYERYCEAGRRIDRRLEALGAHRLAQRVECDVDFEDPAAAWTAAVVRMLAPVAQTPPSAPVPSVVGMAA